MPITKHAYLRYQVLDECFRNKGREYNIEDLIDECNQNISEIDPSFKGISRRQLFYDIKFMESDEGWNVPLIKPRINRKAYYQYSKPGFSILNQPPSKLELEQIEIAKVVISRLASLDEFHWMYELVPQLDELFSDTQKKVIDFSRNEFLKGLEFLGLLHESILNKQVLEITYEPFHKDEQTSIFHPQYLKQFNNRWFLFGHIDDYENLTNFALDRIKNIKEVSKNFIRLDIDFEEYFEDIVGVSRNIDDEPIEIKMHFTPSRSPYILTKPLHGSQKSKMRDDGGLEVTIEVIPNNELIALLLSFGEDVTVIAPDHLKNEIIAILKDSLSKY